jgi:hypothetical protein
LDVFTSHCHSSLVAPRKTASDVKLSHTVQASVLYCVPTRDFHLASCVLERNSALIVKPYLSSLESLMGFLPDVVPRTAHIQSATRGKVSIQGGHNVGHSKQKNCICTCVLF